jgi:glycosyltransferase involved in cell wall biosynthesis
MWRKGFPVQQYLFSVIIPASNEEKFLPGTIGAIRRAEAALGQPVEIVVGDNMSTDATAAVAESLGARVAPITERNISAVRNGAAEAASGKYLVFCDADDHLSEGMLVEIKRAMETGSFVGGGAADTRYDRKSLGLFLTHDIMISLPLRLSGLSMFLFFTSKEDYHAMGGFNEAYLSAEDLEFAKRMKRHGKKTGRRYCNLKTAYLVKSSRKFDEYGDWAVFRHPITFIRASLRDPKVVYELWYKPRRDS